jgi:hypothetical protein
MYGKVPELKDGHLFSCKDIINKHGLCCEGLSPKCIKIPKDSSLEDVSKVFDPLIN